jgi:hypothetical protein
MVKLSTGGKADENVSCVADPCPGTMMDCPPYTKDSLASSVYVQQVNDFNMELRFDITVINSWALLHKQHPI